MRTTSQIMADMGDALRARRVALDLTQKGLAERANVTTRTIHNLENGQPISLNTLIDVARALGLVHLLADIFAQEDEAFTSLKDLEKDRQTIKRVRMKAPK
jgi:transcriptional regulator with XRE-family HTH domain